MLGLDVDSIDDMIELHKTHNIRLFQIYASKIKLNSNNIPNKLRVVVHSSYTINLCQTWKSSDWWINQFIEEIDLAQQIGAFGVVIHVGKNVQNLSIGSAINNMYSALLYILDHTSNINIFIETPAGQGTEILIESEDFIKFALKFRDNPRIGVCIDTCHVFAAGHDINNLDGISRFFKTYADLIGLDIIKLIHLNNSMYELGSKKDRHSNMNIGAISLESIETIVKFVDKLGIPMILETPSGSNYSDVLKDVKIVKKMID